ncbi:tyrosine-protein kinase [Paenibacillus sp. CCS19]|uniref:CpsD/CapB family tyrosine-protein kinase n=1 Tax=Paenibacillus sp. CCS19 TaxID=3158387 RepID=UPI002565E416|nr:CpsD/CapB family tyrosine-protein kinase [Paenibacillus cellulosilyticus]GMK38127.1 tyrosine-protein kinase [Paenibacillus cellulosilyticus]
MSRSKNKLVMLSGMSSEAMERYRSLRAQLDRASGGDARIVAVASPKAGGGAAEMAANLAAAYAQSDRRTLLVDGDFNAPLIHQFFGLSNWTGLSSIIDASSEAGEVDVVHRDVIANLDVLTAGPRLPYSKDFVGAFPLQLLFDSWRQQYDQICLAVPSLMSSADAQLMTAACDGVLLVIRSGQVDDKEAVRVKRLLALLEVPTLGVALAHG